MTPREESLLRTLCYSDIFDYPLTKEELWTFQVSGHFMDPPVKPEDDIQNKHGFYFLQGRERIIEIRRKREKYSQLKLQKAKQLSRIFKLIPTIKLIAITGAVAAGNAKQDDDIDLMIVTSRGWIWTTRFLTILLAEIWGVRRRPNASDLKDMLCFNMFLDEDHISVPSKERDLFSANEVARVKILWEKEETAERFWESNRWIIKYLPHVVVQLPPEADQPLVDAGPFYQGGPLQFIEYILQSLQLSYMKRRRTNEIIKHGYLRFHPKDARKWILRKYHERLKRVGLE